MNAVLKRAWVVTYCVALSVLAAAMIALAVVAFRAAGRPAEWALAFLFVLSAVVLAPIYRTLVVRLSPRVAPGIGKALRIARVIVVVLRVQVLIVLTVIVAANFSRIKSLAVAAFEYYNVLPVRSSMMRTLETRIGQGEAEAVWDSVSDIPSYRRRVNLARLVAAHVTYAAPEASRLAERGDTSMAQQTLAQAFTMFDAAEVFAAVDSGRFTRSRLSRYIKKDVLADAAFELSFYSRAVSRTDDFTTALGILRKIGDTDPRAALFEAEYAWSNSDVRRARVLCREFLQSAQSERYPAQQRAREIADAPESFGPDALLLIYKWFLEDRGGDWVYGGAEPVLHVGSRALGVFRGDIEDLVSYYGGGIGYYAWLFTAGGNQKESGTGAFSLIAVQDEDQPGSDEERPFQLVNPKLVAWGSENLIPPPDAEIGGVRCQTIYDEVFRPFFRLKAFSYRFVRSIRNIDSEIESYRSAMHEEDFHAPSWLSVRFGSIEMVGNALAHDLTVKSIGWWLRRGIDGSSEELWKGLERIMSRYDNTWFTQLNAEPAAFLTEYAPPGDDYPEGYSEEDESDAP